MTSKQDVPEKAMAPHSSTLAWIIPWMEEPGGLQSMGSLGVGHDWATSLSLLTFMYWRRKWQPTPVFVPGESQGRGSLVGWRRGDSCPQQDRVGWKEISSLILRMAHNVKLTNCLYLWNFPSDIFGPWLAPGAAIPESKTTDKWGQWY